MALIKLTKKSKVKKLNRKKVKSHMKTVHKKHIKHHKKTHKKTQMRKKHLKKGKHSKTQKGGYGPGACPQVGPPWNPVKGGHYYSNGTPIGVGGTDPYGGDISPAPQTTFSTAATLSGQAGGSAANPLIPQPLLDAYRGLLYNAHSMFNTAQGLRPPPSVSPWDQDFQQP